VAAIVSAACWVLDAATFWLVALALHAPVSPAAALLISAVTVLGTALPSAPGYVGTFDLAAAAAARALGVASSPAAALALLAHAVTVLSTAGAGAVSLVVIDARLGRLATDSASAERAAAETAT
jgi:glycosyltransferase 2 family protein